MKLEQPKDYVIEQILEDVCQNGHMFKVKTKFRLWVTFAFAMGLLVGTFLF